LIVGPVDINPVISLAFGPSEDGSEGTHCLAKLLAPTLTVDTKVTGGFHKVTPKSGQHKKRWEISMLFMDIHGYSWIFMDIHGYSSTISTGHVGTNCGDFIRTRIST